jgi:hypothetical protein
MPSAFCQISSGPFFRRKSRGEFARNFDSSASLNAVRQGNHPIAGVEGEISAFKIRAFLDSENGSMRGCQKRGVIIQKDRELQELRIAGDTLRALGAVNLSGFHNG